MEWPAYVRMSHGRSFSLCGRAWERWVPASTFLGPRSLRSLACVSSTVSSSGSAAGGAPSGAAAG
ncbi:hypothetical protein GCM10027075_17790 [Streptomyces heilongjiangensis]